MFLNALVSAALHDADSAKASTLPPEGPRVQHRRCAFELDLSCGHVVTYAVTG